MMEVSDILNILNNDDQYKAKIEELGELIQKNEELINAKGGIQRIDQLEREARSQAEIARKTLIQAKEEAEVILEKANQKAQEIEQISNERADKMQILLTNKQKDNAEIAEALKKEKVLLNKESTKLKEEHLKIEKEWAQIRKEKERIDQFNSVLSQLPT